MKSQDALNILTAGKEQFDSIGAAFGVALEVLQNGFTSDQERIDAAIEADKSARQAEIDGLTARAESAETALSNETTAHAETRQKLDQALIDNGVVTAERDALQRRVNELEGASAPQDAQAAEGPTNADDGAPLDE